MTADFRFFGWEIWNKWSHVFKECFTFTEFPWSNSDILIFCCNLARYIQYISPFFETIKEFIVITDLLLWCVVHGYVFGEQAKKHGWDNFSAQGCDQCKARAQVFVFRDFVFPCWFVVSYWVLVQVIRVSCIGLWCYSLTKCLYVYIYCHFLHASLECHQCHQCHHVLMDQHTISKPLVKRCSVPSVVSPRLFKWSFTDLF